MLNDWCLVTSQVSLGSVSDRTVSGDLSHVYVCLVVVALCLNLNLN